MPNDLKFCHKTSKPDKTVFEKLNPVYVTGKVANMEHFLCM